MTTVLKAGGVWLVMLAGMILNGAARQAWLTPWLGEHTANQWSCLSAMVLLLALAGGFVGKLGVRSTAGLLGIGGLWLGLTLAFEFLAGHYIFGASWEQLLADFDLLHGRLWPIVLLTTLTAPLLTARFRGL